MFRIEDGRSNFYQWDINRRLIIEDPTITQVHFCNRTDDCSLVCDAYTDNGVRVVDVPNILLQENWRINVYAFDSNYTKYFTVFNVAARSKPADYVYTETEIHTWEQLAEKVDNIPQVVEDYLKEHPVEVDLSDYALKKDIPSTEGLASEDYVDEMLAKSLEDYALKEELPIIPVNVSAFHNDSGYQTEAEVLEAVKSVKPDLSGYYTKDETEDLILTMLGAVENGYY